MRHVRCPNCQESLRFPDSRTQAFCEFCGTRLVLPGANAPGDIPEKTFDPAATPEFPAFSQEMKAKYRPAPGSGAGAVVVILIFACLGGGLLLLTGSSEEYRPVAGFLFVLALMFAFVFALDDSIGSRRPTPAGYLACPAVLEDPSGLDYQTVYDLLVKATYTAVSGVNLKDLNRRTAACFKVSHITADGKPFKPGNFYAPTALIVIHYHGMP